MGWSISWIAVEPSAERALFEHFGFEELEETSEMADFTISCARINGWTLVQWDQADFLIDESLLRTISMHGRAVAVMVEEHVMFSSAEEWRGGERIWGAVHASDMDLMHIGTEGDVPSAFSEIHARQLAQQEKDGGYKAGVDHIFDIPLDLAETVVGYKHDRGEWSFREVEALRVPKEGSTVHRRIDGTSATSGTNKKGSRWYQQEQASKPGLFARLFGKGRS